MKHPVRHSSILAPKRSQRGQATVEYAFAFLVFAAFLFFMTDMVQIGYSWSVLQFAVNEGARSATISDPAGDQARLDAAEARTIEIARNLGIDGVTVTIQDNGANLSEFTATTTLNLNPLSDLVMRIGGNYNRDFNITATTLARNELFF